MCAHYYAWTCTASVSSVSGYRCAALEWRTLWRCKPCVRLRLFIAAVFLSCHMTQLMYGATEISLLAKCHTSHNEHGAAFSSILSDVRLFYRTNQSEVGERGLGGRIESPLPTVPCLLSFDLLPQVSRRMDEQKGQCRGNAQGCFPFPLSCFVFKALSLCVLK